MDRKLISAALFVTVLGTLFLLTPLANVFQLDRQLWGVPVAMIYLFAGWLVLILAAWWLSHRLPRETEAVPPDGDES